MESENLEHLKFNIRINTLELRHHIPKEAERDRTSLSIKYESNCNVTSAQIIAFFEFYLI